MFLLLSLALFALLLLIPAVATVREVIRPRDDGHLHIPELYERDPRWFGRSYRAKLAPFVATARGDDTYHADVQLRTDEETRWAIDMNVPALERLRGIAVGERIRVGHGAGIRDAYAIEALTVERDVVARTLTSDGSMRIGDSVSILRWIDSDGEITVGAGSNLGVSASGGERVTLAAGVRFERVWGKPVVTRSAATAPLALSEYKHAKYLVQADVEADKPIIHYGPLRIASATLLFADLKVHGPLDVETGVHISGNVIARGDVTFAADVTVDGHVFSECDIYLGPGCRVGRQGGVKTVYAAGHMSIANDVEVEGWIVAEDGGQTL